MTGRSDAGGVPTATNLSDIAAGCATSTSSRGNGFVSELVEKLRRLVAKAGDLDPRVAQNVRRPAGDRE